MFTHIVQSAAVLPEANVHRVFQSKPVQGMASSTFSSLSSSVSNLKQQAPEYIKVEPHEYMAEPHQPSSTSNKPMPSVNTSLYQQTAYHPIDSRSHSNRGNHLGESYDHKPNTNDHGHQLDLFSYLEGVCGFEEDDLTSLHMLLDTEQQHPAGYPEPSSNMPVASIPVATYNTNISSSVHSSRTNHDSRAFGSEHDLLQNANIHHQYPSGHDSIRSHGSIPQKLSVSKGQYSETPNNRLQGNPYLTGMQIPNISSRAASNDNQIGNTMNINTTTIDYEQTIRFQSVVSDRNSMNYQQDLKRLRKNED